MDDCSGRITIDDVVDVIREDADHSLMRSMAGLDEDEDTFSTLKPPNAGPSGWVSISSPRSLHPGVIGMFDQTLEKGGRPLAVLMPIVASMGGIAGSQALTAGDQGAWLWGK